MPVKHNVVVKRITDNEFYSLDYKIMELVFSVHKDLGRFYDEKIYQDELALKWSSKNGHFWLSRFAAWFFLIGERGFITQCRVQPNRVIVGDVIKNLHLRRQPRNKPVI